MIEASYAMEPQESGDFATDLLQAGEILFQSGDVLRAEDCFVQCVREDPECADGWSNLGVILYHLERPVESRCAFENALGLDPHHEAANEGIASLDDADGITPEHSNLGGDGAAIAVDPSIVPVRDLTILPAFRSPQQFAEHLGRVLWLIGPHVQEIRSLHLVISNEIDPQQTPSWPAWMDARVGQLFDFLKPIITWHRSEQITKALHATPQALVWSQEGMQANVSLLRSFGVREQLIEERWVDIDPTAHRNSLHSAPIAIHDIFAKERSQEMTQTAERRLADAFDHLKAEGRDLSEWHVVGGGPSVRNIAWPPDSNAIRVVCNRFLEDKDLCDRVNPSFLAVMDAGYVGCSQAGAAWRERIANWMSQDINRYILTMDRFGPWIEDALPNYLRSRVIALPSRSVGLPMSSWHGDLHTNFWLPDAHNVMTSVCLPVAATLAKSIIVYGMDGASPTEGYVSFGTTYSPQETAQEGDPFMDAWYAAHPRVDEDEYSKTYRENLNASLGEIFVHLEQDRGIRIASGTPSHIPALAQRQSALS